MRKRLHLLRRGNRGLVVPLRHSRAALQYGRQTPAEALSDTKRERAPLT